MTGFSKIRFGSGLAVTDEGGGVITVSSSGGSGGTGPPGPTGPTGPAGPAGPAGPNVVNDSTASPLVGLLKANGTDIDVAVAGTDYVTVTQLGNKVDRDAVEAATNRLVQVKLAAGDAQPAFKIQGDGKLQWGQGGATAPDTNLYRNGTDVLKTDDQFQVASWQWVNHGITGSTVLIGHDLTTQKAAIVFGNDVNLYRAGASQLQTNGTFTVGYNFGVAGTERPLGLFVNVNGTISQVIAGPPDSAGGGYRMLKVYNGT